MAPLVLLGIDRIIDKEKMNLLYIFSLALAIICNIQMGFGLCIFSVIYYIYSFNIRYNIKKDLKKYKKLSLIFIISSICAGAIASGFILALLSNYEASNIGRNLGVKIYSQTSSIDYIIKNLFSVDWIKKDYFNNNEPYIYCGLIMILLFILYLFDQNIDRNKRKHTFIVVMIFIISFCIKFLNAFWHLSEPVLFNYRYSVFLSLFLVVISYEYYITKVNLIRKDMFILFITVLVGIIIDLIYIKEIYIKETLIFMFFITFLLYATKNISKKFELLLSIAVIFEIIFSAVLSFYTNQDLHFDRYSSFNSLNKLNSLNSFKQDYRVITDYTYTERLNDGFLLNNNSSLRYFSSVINGNVLNFFYKNLTPSGKTYYNVSAYDSPLLLSLLGNKYFYILDDIDSGIYTKVNEYKIKSYDYKKKKLATKKVYLYENPYALSLGYVIDSDVKYKKKYDVIDYQNSLIKGFVGSDKDVIKKLEYGISKYDNYCMNSEYIDCKKYYVDNNTDNKYIYFYAPSVLIDSGKYVKIYGDYGEPRLVFNDDDNYELYLIPDIDYDPSEIGVATYDKDSLKILQENMLTNVKINKNIMKAKLDSSKEGILFLSIPYDKRFKIYIDGKKVKYYPLLDDTFIGLDVRKGKHNIKLINIDNNLKWYITSSVISLIFTLILYRFINKRF